MNSWQPRRTVGSGFAPGWLECGLNAALLMVLMIQLKEVTNGNN